MAGNGISGSNSGLFGIPPGGPWFVFPASGTIQRQSNPLFAQALASSGWIGFPTQAAAKAYASGGSIAAKVDSVTGGTAAVGDFLSRLTQASTWIRVAELALGVILIAIGIARITHASEVATKIAGHAAKAGAKIGEVAALA